MLILWDPGAKGPGFHLIHRWESPLLGECMITQDSCVKTHWVSMQSQVSHRNSSFLHLKNISIAQNCLIDWNTKHGQIYGPFASSLRAMATSDTYISLITNICIYIYILYWYMICQLYTCIYKSYTRLSLSLKPTRKVLYLCCWGTGVWETLTSAMVHIGECI